MREILIIIMLALSLCSCSEEKQQTNNDTKQSKATEVNKIKTADIKSTVEQANNKEATNLNKPEESKQKLNFEIKPISSFNLCKEDIVLGNAKSNVVMIEYFSPTCPHCAYYNKAIFPQIKQKYIDTNKIAYIVREFIGNKQDLDAAILARCNGNIDSFLLFHKVLLEQQDKWAYSKKYRELLTNIGGLGGVSAEVYAKCLNDDKIIGILLANTQFVARVPQFVGTPSFFINGVQIAKGYTFEILSNAIEQALKSIENNANS